MTRYEEIEQRIARNKKWASRFGPNSPIVVNEINPNTEVLEYCLAALALPEDSNENTDESRWAARCGMIQGERDIAIHALNKIARRISKEPSHSKEAMAIIAADALDKIGSVFTYCKSCGGAHPRDPVLPACQTQVTEDSKVVNAELYELAIELADSAARSDVECLCVVTGFTERELTPEFPDFAEDVARAIRYLELREASGEPMPYKVVRDGDKVRFDVPAPPKDGE